MRVLAEYDRYPLKQTDHKYGWGWWDRTSRYHTVDYGQRSNVEILIINSGVDRSELPERWLALTQCRPELIYHTHHYPTRREAHDAAALAWLKLTPLKRRLTLIDLDRIRSKA